MFGQLIPQGGGDSIPLLKKDLLVGRRESCDIVLRFSNVSAHHCQLFVSSGYWYVRDKNSRNGVKVNGVRINTTIKRVDPGDVLAIAHHNYELQYSPVQLGAVGPPPPDQAETDIFSRSLLDRAGLKKDDTPAPARPKPRHEGQIRFDITDDGPDDLRSSQRPV